MWVKDWSYSFITQKFKNKWVTIAKIIINNKESWLFKTFTKFELPLFRGQILQFLLHCNARVGGWVGMFTRLFLSHSPCPISLHNTTLHKLIFCNLVLMYALYHIIIPCHVLTCLPIMNASFECFVNKWHPLPICLLPLTPCLGV